MPDPEIRLRLFQFSHQRGDRVQNQLGGQGSCEEEEVEPEAARPPDVAEHPYGVVRDHERRGDGLADEVGQNAAELVDFLKKWQKGRKWQNDEMS